MAQTKRNGSDCQKNAKPALEANDACQSRPAERSESGRESRVSSNERVEMAAWFSQFGQGVIDILPRAGEVLTKEEMFYAFARHGMCDWGDIEREEWEANDHALQHGGRLQSRYRTSRGIRLSVATEADHSTTRLDLLLDD